MEGNINKKTEIKKLDNLGKCKIIEKGNKLTIVASSYLVHEARIALRYLKKFKIDCELIDLRVIKPLDWKTIGNQLKKQAIF